MTVKYALEGEREEGSGGGDLDLHRALWCARGRCCYLCVLPHYLLIKNGVNERYPVKAYCDCL